MTTPTLTVLLEIYGASTCIIPSSPGLDSRLLYWGISSFQNPGATLNP
jgi:hypothetical protein